MFQGGVASQKTLISVTPRQEWRSGMRRRVNFVFIINIIDDCGEQTITLRKRFPQYPFDNCTAFLECFTYYPRLQQFSNSLMTGRFLLIISTLELEAQMMSVDPISWLPSPSCSAGGDQLDLGNQVLLGSSHQAPCPLLMYESTMSLDELETNVPSTIKRSKSVFFLILCRK